MKFLLYIAVVYIHTNCLLINSIAKGLYDPQK